MITKTRFLEGRQCLKRLWLASHGPREPELEPAEVLADREADGAAVEALAEELFPDGVRVAPGETPDLSAGRTLFQAPLRAEDLLAIVDVLEARKGGVVVWEVKASAFRPDKAPKPVYDWDLAYQVHVARAAGLTVVGAGLLLVDGAYVLSEAGLDPQALIVRLDRTAEVEALADGVREALSRQRAALAAPEAPERWPAPRCKGSRSAKEGDRPSTCGHLDRTGACGQHLPPHWAGTLPRLRGPRAEHVARTPNLEIEALDPNDARLEWSDEQQRVIRAVRAGAPEVDPAALLAALETLEWPVAYLDFEFDPNVAIPRHIGMRPFDRLPFQWALAVQERPDAPLGATRHFLQRDGSDPRRPFAESLLAALPASGSIVAHHAPAETTVLEQLAERLGEPIAARLRALVPRFRDTVTIASAGFYAPAQQGSYSIKKLAPALCGRGYEDLAIANGMQAVAQWRRAVDPATPDPERERLTGDLERYCGRDAELMHALLSELRRLSGWRPSAG
ncbi:MAG: DUF2779 domain-containing protein [Planctomycetota bacterium]